MSTPDKLDASASGRTADAGVNAFKLNRAGLVPPKAPVAAESTPAAIPVAAPVSAPTHARMTRHARRNGLSILVLVAALGGLWVAVRESRHRPEDAVAPALTRGLEPRGVAMPDYRALVIGINQYRPEGGTGWQALQSARPDAEAVAKTLSEQYGFQVKSLLDGEATRAGILSALDELVATSADTADLVYFAGHGFFDETLQEGYWIPSDARRQQDGRAAKEDWLWNSTITRLINASRARHVLVLSDACYSGSLFRGDEPLRSRSGQAWYERAIAKPSRFLISSGGLEPVLDSGSGHSVFAQQVLNYLQQEDRTVFSANDLGLALRERVASLTGQMVQMGPLPVSGHAGGEFVFLRSRGGAPLAAFSPRVDGEGAAPGQRGPDAGEADRQAAARDAVALAREGAPKAAQDLVDGLLRRDAGDPLALAVAGYLTRSQRQEARDELRALMDAVAAQAKQAVDAAPGAKAPGARPRVLACIGPNLPEAGTPDGEVAALLYRIVLRSELESRASIKVIEREALETLLQEQNLGVSNLADPKARLAIGKLLPASLLLLGDLLPQGQGEKVFLRLVDTETTQVLASFSGDRQPGGDTEVVCADLAARIADRIVALKPLHVAVASVKGTRLQAPLGTFQGVREGTAFTVVQRTVRDKRVPEDIVEQPVGTATVAAVAEFSCELEAVWASDGPPNAQDLWIRETPL